MLNCLPFVVLLASCLKEFVVASKPVEDFLIAVSCAIKQRVFAQVVFLLQGFVLVVFENVQNLEVLRLAGQRDRSLPVEILLQTHVRFEFKETLCKLEIPIATRNMQWSVTFVCVHWEQIQTGVVINQEGSNLLVVVFNCQVEGCFALGISAFQQLDYLSCFLS